jgi:hypothetical protein
MTYEPSLNKMVFYIPETSFPPLDKGWQDSWNIVQREYPQTLQLTVAKMYISQVF